MKPFCITTLSHNQKGQSVMEYLLLLFVVVSLSTAFITSDAFKSIMGENSFFFTKLKEKQEYSFRHAQYTDTNDDSTYNGPQHHSYKNPESNNSRFFAPAEEYPIN
jgi:hypothetical protein